MSARPDQPHQNILRNTSLSQALSFLEILPSVAFISNHIITHHKKLLQSSDGSRYGYAVALELLSAIPINLCSISFIACEDTSWTSAFMLYLRNYSKQQKHKNTSIFFFKTILYNVHVKDNMLEQRFPRKMYYFCNNGGTSQKHNW